MRTDNTLKRTRGLRVSPQETIINWNNKSLTNFCSNNYLNLANHPDIKSAFIKGIDQFGVGSGASHLIGGYCSAHQDLENAFAEFLGVERCLYFANGYMANAGVINTLTKKGDVIYADKLVHASIIDACLASPAKLIRYPHLQPRHYEERRDAAIYISDSVFSMDGDIANVPELMHLSDRVIIDDAHGIGVLGENGAGITSYYNITHNKPILICPLGKAFGVYGCVVAASNDVIEHLIQAARSYIYTTSPPPALSVAALASLELVKKESWRREKLNELIYFFKKTAAEFDLPLLKSDTPIQPLLIGDTPMALNVSEQLFHAGFMVRAIREPTVPKGRSRLRITLNCEHTEQQILTLLTSLRSIAATVL